MRRNKIWIGMLAAFLLTPALSWAQDPGWPRKLVKPGGTLIIYQPQVDDWQDFIDLKWRQAFELTTAAAEAAVGVEVGAAREAAAGEGSNQNGEPYSRPV